MTVHLPVWAMTWESVSLAICDRSSVLGNPLMVSMSRVTKS